MQKNTRALKESKGKPRTDLLPIDSTMEIVKALSFGALKYEAHNWRKGMPWSEAYASLLRHTFKWWSGEDTDVESGLPHLAHAGVWIHFLLHYGLEDVGEDDRPKSKVSPRKKTSRSRKM